MKTNKEIRLDGLLHSLALQAHAAEDASREIPTDELEESDLEGLVSDMEHDLTEVRKLLDLLRG